MRAGAFLRTVKVVGPLEMVLLYFGGLGYLGAYPEQWGLYPCMFFLLAALIHVFGRTPRL